MNEPRRWSEELPSNAEAQRAAALFEGARELPPLPLEALARIEVGVSASLASTGVAAWVKVTLASAALVAGGGTAAWFSLRGDPTARSPLHTPPAAMRTPVTEAVAEDLVEPAAPPLPEPAPIAAPVQHRAQASERAAPTRTRRGPTPSALAREASLLEAALSHLDRNEPTRALTALEAYAREFPNGQLAAEAKVARIDALVAAGRRTDALKLLLELDDADLPRASELRILRAELLAESGDCRRALGDFEAALRDHAQGPLAARALRGRGRCRLALGDVEGGETDLLEAQKK